MNFTDKDVVYRSRKVTAYFKMDYPGIVRYAMQSQELGEALEDLARSTVAYARSISPNGFGDYRQAWDHQPYIERETGDPPFPRQAQLVTNDSTQALNVEFGTGRGSTYESYYGHRIFPQLFDYLEDRA